MSAPVPVTFLCTLDFGFWTWILDLDLGLEFRTWIWDLDLGLTTILLIAKYSPICEGGDQGEAETAGGWRPGLRQQEAGEDEGGQQEDVQVQEDAKAVS